MNINKLFKVVTVLFVFTAVLALVFVAVAVISDKKEETGTEQTDREDKETTEKTEEKKTTKDVPPKEEEAENSVEIRALDSSKDLAEDESLPRKEESEPLEVKENEIVPNVPEAGNDEGTTSGGTAGEDSIDVIIEPWPTFTAEGFPIGQNVPKENLKFDGTETHFVLQNINYQVNVRKEASKSSDKVGELLKGSYGVVLEKGPEFSLVQCGDLTGYILNSYLMMGRAADEQIQGISSRKVKIDKACYVRDDANMESNKLGTVAAGAEYSFDPTAPEVRGWVAIVYDDAPKAYVSAAFCTVE